MFTFIESPAFDRLREVYLDDDEYAELQQFMILNPEAGDLVRGSGGVRKLRWKRKGSGKRGGLRVIYFVRYRSGGTVTGYWTRLLRTARTAWPIPGNCPRQRENAPAHILKQLKEEIQDE